MITDYIYSVEEQKLLINFEDGSMQTLTGTAAKCMFNFLIKQEDVNDKHYRNADNSIINNSGDLVIEATKKEIE